jgi:hypothetical protein
MEDTVAVEFHSQVFIGDDTLLSNSFGSGVWMGGPLVGDISVQICPAFRGSVGCGSGQ